MYFVDFFISAPPDEEYGRSQEKTYSRITTNLPFGEIFRPEIAISCHFVPADRLLAPFVDTNEQIIECCSITGDHDFMLKVVAHSPGGLEQFIMKRLLATGLVRESRSNFVLRQNKTRGSLPTQVV